MLWHSMERPINAKVSVGDDKFESKNNASAAHRPQQMQARYEACMPLSSWPASPLQPEWPPGWHHEPSCCQQSRCSWPWLGPQPLCAGAVHRSPPAAAPASRSSLQRYAAHAPHTPFSARQPYISIRYGHARHSCAHCAADSSFCCLRLSCNSEGHWHCVLGTGQRDSLRTHLSLTAPVRARNLCLCLTWRSNSATVSSRFCFMPSISASTCSTQPSTQVNTCMEVMKDCQCCTE